MSRKNVAIALLTVFAASCSSVPPSARFLSAGTYSAAATDRFVDPNVPTGHYSQSRGIVLIERTDHVSAIVGTRFGVSYSFDGPAGTVVRHKVVWKFPQPGMRNAATGQAATSSEREIECMAGTECWAGRVINEPWEIVEGPWILEIWQGSRKLLTHAVKVSKG